MRLIFTDEAGTSELESAVAVAAIIVEDGAAVGALEAEIQRIIDDRVPTKLRENFYIHTADVFHGKKGMRDWPLADRMDFLKEVGCLAYVHDIPIAVSYCYKVDWNEAFGEGGVKAMGMTSNQYNHLLMFSLCMDAADLFLRKYLEGSEEGVVIAEDVIEMRRPLQMGGLVLREAPFELPGGQQIRERSAEILDETPENRIHRIEKIVGTPRFVKKREAGLLQLADIIAFSFRRFATQKIGGAHLVQAILGPDQGPAVVNDPAWRSQASHALFNTDAYLSERELAARNFRRRLSSGDIVVFDAAKPDALEQFSEDLRRSKNSDS